MLGVSVFPKTNALMSVNLFSHDISRRNFRSPFSYNPVSGTSTKKNLQSPLPPPPVNPVLILELLNSSCVCSLSPPKSKSGLSEAMFMRTGIVVVSAYVYVA